MRLYLYIALVLLVTTNNCLSQDEPITIGLPSLEELDSCLIAFTDKECSAQLNAYSDTRTKPWKELLPSVGLGYTALGELRPSVSWSPLQVLDRQERKMKNELQRQSVLLSCDVLKAERIHKLHQLYHNYLVEFQIIESRRSTLLIDEELFAITERKYEEHLIKPSEYLSAKRSNTQARSDLEVMVLELEKLGNEVLWVARW